MKKNLTLSTTKHILVITNRSLKYFFRRIFALLIEESGCKFSQRVYLKRLGSHATVDGEKTFIVSEYSRGCYRITRKKNIGRSASR